MPTEKNLASLVINEVESTAVYEEMKRQGLLNDDELYLVTDPENTANIDQVPTAGSKNLVYSGGVYDALQQAGSADSVNEWHNGEKQRFWRGTKEEYEALAEKPEDTLFILTDDEGEAVTGGSEIYVGPEAPESGDFWIDTDEEGEAGGSVDAYTKEETLSEETKVAFNLGADAVPDDVFGVLSRFQNGLGNEYVWEKTKRGYTESEGDSYVSSVVGPSSSTPGKIRYSDTVSCDENGKAVLSGDVTEISVSYSANAGAYPNIVGKYAQQYLGDSYSDVFKVTVFPEIAVNQFAYIHGIKIVFVLGVVHYGYVNSPDPNAYPVDDGYTYTALGQLGAGSAKIQHFSYVGTGVYGANNPNTMTFDFPVTLLAMLAVGSEQMDCSDQYRSYAKFLLVSAMPTEYTSKAGLGYPTANSYGKRSDDYKTVYWYHLGGAADQFNSSGTTYYGFAIG